MQPGYPGPGQDPYGQQPPYVDPYAQPQYPPQPQQSQQPQQPEEGQPPTGDPYGQPPQYQDPYAQPTSGPGYPGAAPYPTGGYGAPPQQNNNTLGLVGMIVGIVSIPLVCCPLLGFFGGVAGIVLGILGMKKASAGEASNRGQALTGVICGAVGIVLSIGWLITSLALHLGNSFPTAP